MLVSLVEDAEKDEDEMQGPKVEDLVHDEEGLGMPKKLRGTALHLEKDFEHFLLYQASLEKMFSSKTS